LSNRFGTMTLLALCVAGVAAAALAQGSPFPLQRDGWWEESMVMAGRPMTMQTCTDAATQHRYSAYARVSGANCSSHQVTPIPGGAKFTSTCTVNGQAHTNVGDFNSHVHFDMTSSGAGGERHMVMDMKYLGACPAGRSPGDVVMPGGMVMNMAAMPH
jgi:hypothetical protein